MSFLPGPRQVARMRRLAAAHLGHRDRIAPDTIHTVQLLVSELVTNAVTHGDSATLKLILTCGPDAGIRIEVDDHSPGTPEPRNPGTPEPRSPGPDDENGRGLLLVTALAHTWGRTGTRTWCTVRTCETTI
ncbi:ATP-binding protein [Streptomyces sp. NPDC051567]|uniref:ATP-binding protein n=1 Tax=Streptomyces sp. NPDC051567 TaxID=3365660 RepID=UPI003796D871